MIVITDQNNAQESKNENDPVSNLQNPVELTLR